MIDNGLGNVMDLIKRQKWEKLFKRRELMHIDAVKEFYARLTLVYYKKKDIARSSEVWEESKYTKPLEITRKLANDNMIMEARRVRLVEMKPFQRFVHFLVMKNVVPKFGKRDNTSYMDLIYMDHLTSRRMLTMVFESFGVPLVDKQGEEPKRYDYFEETFLSMCQLKRENGVWWIGSGENRRRDDEEATPAENEEVNEEEAEAQPEFDWEAVVNEAALQGESGSDDQFHDAQVEVEEPVAEAPAVPVFPTSPGDSTNQQKETEAAGVDPLGPTGHIPDSVMSKLQAEFERARANRIQADLEKAQAENARLLALLQQAQSQPKP
ncbi:hypothetical protein Dimus_020464 [Dionaea muscipula]